MAPLGRGPEAALCPVAWQQIDLLPSGSLPFFVRMCSEHHGKGYLMEGMCQGAPSPLPPLTQRDSFPLYFFRIELESEGGWA